MQSRTNIMSRERAGKQMEERLHLQIIATMYTKSTNTQQIEHTQ